MKKTIAILSILTFLILNPKKMTAQYYPNLDELLDMALCKDSTCFRKAMEAKGLFFVSMGVTPHKNGYFTIYADKIKEKDGTENLFTWVYYNKKEGPSKYIDFSTTNLPAYTKLMDKADERGFSFLKKQTLTDANDRLMMAFFYKKSATGLQTTLSKLYTPAGNEVERYSFAAKIPADPKWPEEY